MKYTFDDYMKSEFWRKYYDDAPSQQLKDYIRAEFERSGSFDPKEKAELNKISCDKESKLTRADYDYLIKREPSKQMKAVYRERQAKLPKK